MSKTVRVKQLFIASGDFSALVNKIASDIKNTLSLRPPQAESLEILAEIADIIELKKNIDLTEAKRDS